MDEGAAHGIPDEVRRAKPGFPDEFDVRSESFRTVRSVQSFRTGFASSHRIGASVRLGRMSTTKIGKMSRALEVIVSQIHFLGLF